MRTRPVLGLAVAAMCLAATMIAAVAEERDRIGDKREVDGHDGRFATC